MAGVLAVPAEVRFALALGRAALARTPLRAQDNASHTSGHSAMDQSEDLKTAETAGQLSEALGRRGKACPYSSTLLIP